MVNIFNELTVAAVSDNALPQAPILDTEEKMRRFLIALATQVQQIQDILTKNNIT